MGTSKDILNERIAELEQENGRLREEIEKLQEENGELQSDLTKAKSCIDDIRHHLEVSIDYCKECE